MAITKIQSESLNLADNYDFTGTVTGAGGVNTPAFFAYLTSNQSIANGASTKINTFTEVFDSTNNFSSGRFTPNEAGKYFVYGGIFMAADHLYTEIFKNGGFYANTRASTDTNNDQGCLVNTVVSMNGTSDYIELYCFHLSGSSTNAEAYGKRTFFGAYKIIE